MRQSLKNTVFVLSLLLVGCFGHGELRGTKRHAIHESDIPSIQGGPRERRKLQMILTALVNALISVATPIISENLVGLVQNYYNTYDFSWIAQPEFMGEEALMKLTTEVAVQQLPSICNALEGNVTSYVQYDYSFMLQQLDGLGVISIDKIAFVEGSQQIDLYIDGLRTGANWLGQWLVETSFESLTANTMASVTATVQQPDCDETEVRATSVNGTVVLTNVFGRSLSTINGKTDRVSLFLSTSEFSAMKVDSLSLSFDPIEGTTLGSFDLGTLDNSAASEAIRNIGSLSAVAPWGDNISIHFKEMSEKLIKYTVEDELNYILPRPLLR